MVKVSVLLTSYNHANFLKQSIDSILNQTMKDFELIIIDDASTDNSWDIIKKYKDKRIIKFKNKKNKGSILTRELVESFKGKYFAVAHCDDYWELTKLEKQYNYLEKHSDVAACFTWVNLVNEDNKEISIDNYTDFNLKNRSRFEWLNYFFYVGNCLCHPSLMMRTNIQLDLDLFTYGMRSLPDFYRWVKLCSYHDIYIYPEKLTNFRIRKGGLNTSGYNIQNAICCSFEQMNILDLYTSFSGDDFLKIFPKTKKYLKDNYFNQKYVLARMCIDELKSNNAVYFGLNLIYQLLQNDADRKNLEKYYHYTSRDFINEKKNYDIFSTISKDCMQRSSIYFMNNDGTYSEDNKIESTVLVNQYGNFEWFVDNINKMVKEFRFDPDEGKLRLYKDISVFVNGKELEFSTNSSLFKEGEYYFYHVDPIFFVSFNGVVHSIYIKGKTRELSLEEYSQFVEIKKELCIKNYKDEMKNKKLLRRIIHKIKKILNF